MVAGFANRVMCLVVLDNMATPSSVTNADACPGKVVHQVMTHSNSLRPRDVYTGDLLSEEPAIMNKVVGGLTFVRKSALRSIGFFQVADKTNRAVASLRELAIGHGEVAIVIIDKHCIAADSVEPTFLNGAVAGAFHEQRPTAVNRPVA